MSVDNAALRDNVAGWRAEGSPAQAPMAWPRERWITTFPAHADALRNVPDLMDREIVREECTHAGADARSAEMAFIIVMAWGYGTEVGYGPWRTHRVLTDNPDAASRLAAVAQSLAEGSALSAYRRLCAGGDCNLRWLGPAFGTKFLYFCQPTRPGEQRALILDNLVASWLRDTMHLSLNPVPWSVPIYGKYLEHMHAWADSLGCSPDELEYCIFRTMAARTKSQWGSAIPSGPTSRQN
jgi:hypothetical protein